VYKELEAWQYGMGLVERVYRVTRAFPRVEQFGLSSQIRRAAVSIPSNLAEGYCRRTTKAYRHHVSIALGSHGELETCLELGRRLGLIADSDRKDLEDSCTTVGKLLSGLYNSLTRKTQGD
jgi:four helix bundle protein